VRAATFHAPGDLRVTDIDEPTAGPRELKLRMHATATCGTDAKIYKHGHPRLEPPQVIGHELAGEVVEVGSEVTGHQVGDRLQVIAAVPCGECWACTSGAMTVCPNQTSMGYQYPGGFAEYMIVPEQVLKVDGVNPIPEGVSYAEASVTEPLACALNAQELVHVGKDDVDIEYRVLAACLERMNYAEEDGLGSEIEAAIQGRPERSVASMGQAKCVDQLLAHRPITDVENATALERIA